MITRRTHAPTHWILSGIAFALAAAPASGQCNPVWDARFAVPGTDGPTFTALAYDLGTGPRVFFGGTFGSAGGVPVNMLASWDGENWSSLEGGADGFVRSSAVFDDGSGPALYAGGSFQNVGGVAASRVARWNGSTWSAVGTGLPERVDALAVFDAGAGPELFAASTTGGVPAISSVHRWNGTAWTAVGSPFSGSIAVLATFDDGGGPRLYAGGLFTAASGVPAGNIARFDGLNWSPVGPGLDDQVLALAAFDEGAGPRLFACGAFRFSGAVPASGVARWDGGAWTGVAGGLSGSAALGQSLLAFDDGAGPALFVGGSFFNAGGTPASGMARWNGSAWSALGSGIQGGGGVAALAASAAGGASALYAAGELTHAGGVFTNRVARWNGSSWSPLGQGMLGQLVALRTATVAGTQRLYAAGSFTIAGTTPMNNVGAWDGNTWSALGSGFPFGGVRALHTHDEGGGTLLYAGGEFTTAGGANARGIARWDGTFWFSLGTGVSGGGARVEAMTTFDDGTGSVLIAGGSFTAAGGHPAFNVARWDGNSWSMLGGGVTGIVRALAVFDDGSGAALYVAGSLTAAGGIPASGIARWNGSAWSVIPGPGLGLTTLLVHDDESGPALYAGGIFSSIGGVPANNIARWNGTAWSALGAGVAGSVEALATFDDGSGPVLYAGGGFTTAGGQSARRVARWNGTTWSALGTGIGALQENGVVVRDLAIFQPNADAAPSLFLAGAFTTAGEFGSGAIAQWRGCPPQFAPYCFGDGTGSACPCGNSGAPGHGCANSVQPSGARLAVSGTASLSADTVTLVGSAMPDSSALYFQGTAQAAGGAGTAFGDGLRCASGSIVRLGTRTNAAGFSSYPSPGDPTLSVRGMVSAPGARTYQIWYRNAAAFCTPSTFNLSNGVSVLWRL